MALVRPRPRTRRTERPAGERLRPRAPPRRRSGRRRRAPPWQRASPPRGRRRSIVRRGTREAAPRRGLVPLGREEVVRAARRGAAPARAPQSTPAWARSRGSPSSRGWPARARRARRQLVVPQRDVAAPATRADRLRPRAHLPRGGPPRSGRARRRARRAPRPLVEGAGRPSQRVRRRLAERRAPPTPREVFAVLLRAGSIVAGHVAACSSALRTSIARLPRA